MRYTFHNGKSVCSECGAEDVRHSCFWRNLEQEPIGSVALSLAGQFSSWNKFEQRVARGIWERVKLRDKPNASRRIDIINTTTLEVWETWCAYGKRILG